jgi:HEPN domain-containing protein
VKTKEEYIQFWITQAEDDWQTVYILFEKKKYLQSLFFMHLAIEKIAKAFWIRDNDTNIPPKTHNLVYLISQTKVELSEDDKEFLLNINRFQIEGRYPDYVSQLYKICDDTFTSQTIASTEKLKTWLLDKLQ